MIAARIIAAAVALVALAGCGSSQPSCKITTHDGKKVCVRYQKQVGPNGQPVIMPIYVPISIPPPVPPEEDPVHVSVPVEDG